MPKTDTFSEKHAVKRKNRPLGERLVDEILELKTPVRRNSKPPDIQLFKPPAEPLPRLPNEVKHAVSAFLKSLSNGSLPKELDPSKVLLAANRILTSQDFIEAYDKLKRSQKTLPPRFLYKLVIRAMCLEYEYEFRPTGTKLQKTNYLKRVAADLKHLSNLIREDRPGRNGESAKQLTTKEKRSMSFGCNILPQIKEKRVSIRRTIKLKVSDSTKGPIYSIAPRSQIRKILRASELADLMTFLHVRIQSVIRKNEEEGFPQTGKRLIKNRYGVRELARFISEQFHDAEITLNRDARNYIIRALIKTTLNFSMTIADIKLILRQ